MAAHRQLQDPGGRTSQRQPGVQGGGKSAEARVHLLRDPLQLRRGGKHHLCIQADIHRRKALPLGGRYAVHCDSGGRHAELPSQCRLEAGRELRRAPVYSCKTGGLARWRWAQEWASSLCPLPASQSLTAADSSSGQSSGWCCSPSRPAHLRCKRQR